MSKKCKQLPPLVFNVQFSVCRDNHVHLEMTNENSDTICELVMENVDDMLSFEKQIRQAIDLALDVK